MRAGEWREGEDEGDEGRARRNGISEQRESEISAGQALGHDPRADDGGKEKRCADRFGNGRTEDLYRSRRRRIGRQVADRGDLALERKAIERGRAAAR